MFEFIVTRELQEAIDDFKEMAKLLKSPKAILEGFGLILCLALIYFGAILLAPVHY